MRRVSPHPSPIRMKCYNWRVKPNKGGEGRKGNSRWMRANGEAASLIAKCDLAKVFSTARDALDSSRAASFFLACISCGAVDTLQSEIRQVATSCGGGRYSLAAADLPQITRMCRMEAYMRHEKETSRSCSLRPATLRRIAVPQLPTPADHGCRQPRVRPHGSRVFGHARILRYNSGRQILDRR